jgi:hypothetical protein
VVVGLQAPWNTNKSLVDSSILFFSRIFAFLELSEKIQQARYHSPSLFLLLTSNYSMSHRVAWKRIVKQKEEKE